MSCVPASYCVTWILCNCFCFSHNHSSGIAEPSQADRQITLKLTQALALVDVRVLDHLVVGDKTVTSMAERGLM